MYTTTRKNTMTVIETQFTKTRAANIVALCDTCNELALNPTVTHTWDDQDLYTGTVTCKECNHA